VLWAALLEKLEVRYTAKFSIHCVLRTPPRGPRRPLAGIELPELRPMAKSKKKAEVVFLVCEETGDMNYVLRRKPGGEKLKLKKYCPRLRKHTLHNEKKK
jgi:large subunit ribosomal protein L33